MSNLETFLDVYMKHLAEDQAQNPDKYAWERSSLQRVRELMALHLQRRTFDNHSTACRRTCKELGIRKTYKAIEEYLRG